MKIYNSWLFIHEDNTWLFTNKIFIHNFEITYIIKLLSRPLYQNIYGNCYLATWLRHLYFVSNRIILLLNFLAHIYL